MTNRPWPLIVLAAVQILMPVFSIIANAALANASPLVYFEAFISYKSGWEIFEFFALYPIAGISILLMKKWSYPVFLAIMAWTIYANVTTWLSDYQTTMSPWVLVAFLAFNIAFVTYYLLPAVRRVYFDKRIRWWESKPRFLIQIPAQVKASSQEDACTVRDLSEGGAFVEGKSMVKIDDSVELTIPILSMSLKVPGKVVHVRNNGGFGIQFAASPSTKRAIRHTLCTLKALGCDVNRVAEPLLPSFFDWLKGALRGKGLVPTAQNHHNRDS